MDKIKERTTLALFGFLGVVLATGSEVKAQRKPIDFGATRETLHQWIETEAKLEELEADWAQEEKTLNEISNVIRTEIGILERKLRESREEISQAEAKREELGGKREELKKASEAIENVIAVLEEQIRSFHPIFPDPLRQTIDAFYSRIPEPGEDTELSLSGRMQNVVAVLTAVDKFNGVVTLDNTGFHEYDGGKRVQKKTIYFGLGFAYFIDSHEKYAGIGVPGEESWEWIPKPELIPLIADLISVYENPQKAHFVRLPLEIN
jgi:uncharacterized coiled-coil protein SlyX